MDLCMKWNQGVIFTVNVSQSIFSWLASNATDEKWKSVDKNKS